MNKNKTEFALVTIATISFLTGTAGNATELIPNDSGNNSSKIAQLMDEVVPKKSDKIVIISHVDVIPQYTSPATLLLKKYRKLSLNESGVKRVAILQQIGRPNHFTIVEEWRDQKALDEHVSAAQTKEFRTELQNMLGAPYDERPHTDLE